MSRRLAFFKWLVDAELSYLEELRSIADSHYKEVVEDLYALAGEEDEGIENYADEMIDLSEIRELALELWILGLYRLVELRSKDALRWQLSESTVKSAYKSDKLKKVLLDELGIDVTSVPGYVALDELRLVSNDLKHEGEVSAGLAAKYPSWKPGEFKQLDLAYDRLRPGIREYLVALAERIDKAVSIPGSAPPSK